MLKKLTKYGSNNTLVIDKAVLELLNIDELSIVNLQTDGKSLIITPVKQDDDAINAAQVADNNIEFNKQASLAAQKEFSDIFTKYGESVRKFSTEIVLSDNFQSALAQIAQKFNPESHPEQYLKEYNKLKLAFCPELDQMEKLLIKYCGKYTIL